MSDTTNQAPSGAGGIVVRHRIADRILHWLSAACVLVLLATSFLPILGIKFEWVTVHWVAGIILLLLLVTHIFRTLRRLGTMWFGLEDIKLAWSSLHTKAPTPKPGKYSPAQKLMHLGVTVLVGLTILTGLIMMAKIDTPLWERNIYLLDDQTWGVIYVVHGFAALSLITTVMLHVYFALRPEKLMYTRAMIKGWLTQQEFFDHHDESKWQADRRE